VGYRCRRRGALTTTDKPEFKEDGIFTFKDVPIAIRAEKILKGAGIENKVVELE